MYVLHSCTDHGLYIGYSTNLKKRMPSTNVVRLSQQVIAARGSSFITRPTWSKRMLKDENAI